MTLLMILWFVVCWMQAVAVKQLDRNDLQENREFLGEFLMVSLLHHLNLVNLIGYFADSDQRLSVASASFVPNLKKIVWSLNQLVKRNHVQLTPLRPELLS